MICSVFKKCLVCQKSWQTRDEFINDADISLIGYQSNFAAIESGLFFFNHSCGATLALSVETFADLYSGSIYVERKSGSEECPGYCLHRREFRPCLARCECAYVREILQLLTRPE